MSYKKWEIDRRTFIKGMGLSIGLPMLDAMIPSVARAADGKTQKFVSIYIPNGLGAIQNYSQNTFDVTPRVLNSLASIRSDMVWLRGLSNPTDLTYGETGDAHVNAYSTFINGGKGCSGKSQYVFKTYDQHIADVNMGTKQKTLHMVAYENLDSGTYFMTTQSYRANGQAAPYYAKPQDVFNAMFADVASGGQVDQRMIDQANKKRGILHYALDEIKKIQNKVGREDKIRLDEYFSGINDLDVKIAADVANTPPLASACTKPSITGDSAEMSQYPVRLQLMYDLIYFALKCDLTRVATLMHSREGSNLYHGRFMSGLHSPGQWHGLSHVVPNFQESSGNNAENQQDIETVVAWHFTQIVKFITRMKQTVLPNGQTMLNQTGVVWGSCIPEGGHQVRGMNMFVAGNAGGALKMNQTITANTLMSNLWLTLMQAYGVKDSKGSAISSFGTANGIIAGLKA